MARVEGDQASLSEPPKRLVRGSVNHFDLNGRQRVPLSFSEKLLVNGRESLRPEGCVPLHHDEQDGVSPL